MGAGALDAGRLDLARGVHSAHARCIVTPARCMNLAGTLEQGDGRALTVDAGRVRIAAHDSFSRSRPLRARMVCCTTHYSDGCEPDPTHRSTAIPAPSCLDALLAVRADWTGPLCVRLSQPRGTPGAGRGIAPLCLPSMPPGDRAGQDRPRSVRPCQSSGVRVNCSCSSCFRPARGRPPWVG